MTTMTINVLNNETQTGPLHASSKYNFDTVMETITPPGWGNEDKQNTAPLNRPYYDTNTALFPTPTLFMPMFAISY